MMSGDDFFDDEITSGPIGREVWTCSVCGEEGNPVIGSRDECRNCEAPALFADKFGEA